MSDEALLRRSPWVVVSAVLGIVSHMVSATTGAQAILYFIVPGVMGFFPWLLLGLGGLGTLASAQLSRHSASGAVGSVAIGLLTLLVNVIWLGFTLYNGLFSLAPLLATGLAALFVPASAIALGPALRVSRAKKQLLEG